MIRLLIWSLLIYIGYRVILSLGGGKKAQPDAARGRVDAAATHRDPVCGVYISEEDAVVGKLNGQRHYFCSVACLEKYREQLVHTPT